MRSADLMKCFGSVISSRGLSICSVSLGNLGGFQTFVRRNGLYKFLVWENLTGAVGFVPSGMGWQGMGGQVLRELTREPKLGASCE